MHQTARRRIERQLGRGSLVEERGTERVDGAELRERQFLLIDLALHRADRDVRHARHVVHKSLDLPLRRLLRIGQHHGVAVLHGEVIGVAGKVVGIDKAQLRGEAEQDLLADVASRHHGKGLSCEGRVGIAREELRERLLLTVQ